MLKAEGLNLYYGASHALRDVALTAEAGRITCVLGRSIVNKLLEPVAGAVLGKVVVLVCIILFIQKRPRGLFAAKGRSADA